MENVVAADTPVSASILSVVTVNRHIAHTSAAKTKQNRSKLPHFPSAIYVQLAKSDTSDCESDQSLYDSLNEIETGLYIYSFFSRIVGFFLAIEVLMCLQLFRLVEERYKSKFVIELYSIQLVFNLHLFPVDVLYSNNVRIRNAYHTILKVIYGHAHSMGLIALVLNGMDFFYCVVVLNQYLCKFMYDTLILPDRILLRVERKNHDSTTCHLILFIFAA